MADGSALLTGLDLESWRDWRRVFLRSPRELHELIALEGRVVPHTDPELKRKPQCYARLVSRCYGLVSFGAVSEATVGVFVVQKKLGKQMLIFDTRRKDGGELCTGSWFFDRHAARGSSPGALDDSAVDLFQGLR